MIDYKFVFVAAWLACVLSASSAEPVGASRAYPRFQIGVTGIEVTIEPGRVVTVQGTVAGSPGDGKFQKGDLLLSANQRLLAVDDPRVPLGQAVGDAEARDGKLAFRIKRSGAELDLIVTIPVLGGYSATWPLACEKSKKIIQQSLEFLARCQQPDGSIRFERDKSADKDGLWACLAGLTFLSAGEDQYVSNAKRIADRVSQALARNPNDSIWHLGYQGIFLSEYYLRTGDKSVLPALKTLCDVAAKAQMAGSWGHGINGPKCPGYTQSGIMNSAGTTMFLAIALARECGVAVDEQMFQRSLNLFYRFAGHGSVCYGDHRAEIYPNTNGRNTMLACAFSILDNPIYRHAAQHLALVDADSYYAPEAGHTGGGFNVIWRGIGTVHVPPDRQKNYQRQMSHLAWYYDLCRQHGGGFSFLPSPPDETLYCGLLWGSTSLGLTYTAPLRNLRITGAPRTKFSASVVTPRVAWGTPADDAFLMPADCAGFQGDTLPPHEAYALLAGRSPKNSTQELDSQRTDLYAQFLRHYNPMMRTWAARCLARNPSAAALAELSKALSHADPRVRRAALDGISGYDNWMRPTHEKHLPPDIVSRHFVPDIVRILQSPKSAWWEIDGALWALGCAEPADVRRNMDVIEKYLRHNEWYLREAAFWAAVGLHKTATAADLLMLADVYAKEQHVFPKGSYDAALDTLLRRDKAVSSDTALNSIVLRLGETLNTQPLELGYDERTRAHEVAHRTMMILGRLDRKVFLPLIPEIQKYLGNWSPDYQHSLWLISGSKWQPGFLKVLNDLGPAGKPLAASLKECLKKFEGDPRRASNTRENDRQQCRAALEKGLAEYEAKYPAL